MLILRMRQKACCNCFCPQRRSTSHYAYLQTNCKLDYPRCMTKYRWCSIDAHFQDGAGSMSLMFLALYTATTSFLDVCKQSRFRLPRSSTKNRWHSTNACFADGTGSVSVLFSTRKAANTLFMNGCNQWPPRLYKMHSQKSLTLHWHSFSESGREPVAIILDLEGSQYLIYEWLQPLAT